MAWLGAEFDRPTSVIPDTKWSSGNRAESSPHTCGKTEKATWLATLLIQRLVASAFLLLTALVPSKD
jgi:hypothetical protein